MPTHTQINYEGIDQNIEYENTINEVLDACFNEEKLNNRKLYINNREIHFKQIIKIREV